MSRKTRVKDTKGGKTERAAILAQGPEVRAAVERARELGKRHLHEALAGIRALDTTTKQAVALWRFLRGAEISNPQVRSELLRELREMIASIEDPDTRHELQVEVGKWTERAYPRERVAWGGTVRKWRR